MDWAKSYKQLPRVCIRVYKTVINNKRVTERIITATVISDPRLGFDMTSGGLLESPRCPFPCQISLHNDHL